MTSRAVQGLGRLPTTARWGSPTWPIPRLAQLDQPSEQAYDHLPGEHSFDIVGCMAASGPDSNISGAAAGDIVPQGADHEPASWSQLCTACGHSLKDHPGFYPRDGTPPSMPCRVTGCGCEWFDVRCQVCMALPPCEHWSERSRSG